MCKSNCGYLEPCKLTTIRFPHSARFSKIVQTGVTATEQRTSVAIGNFMQNVSCAIVAANLDVHCKLKHEFNMTKFNSLPVKTGAEARSTTELRTLYLYISHIFHCKTAL